MIFSKHLQSGTATLNSSYPHPQPATPTEFSGDEVLREFSVVEMMGVRNVGSFCRIEGVVVWGSERTRCPVDGDRRRRMGLCQRDLGYVWASSLP